MKTQFWKIPTLGLLCISLLLCSGISSAGQVKGGSQDDAVRRGTTDAGIGKTREKAEPVKNWPLRSVAANAVAPMNDNFANASLLGTSYNGVVNNVGATGEPGEPIHGAGRGGDNPSQTNSIWYKIVASSTGVVEMYTHAPQSDPIDDTVMSAYTGSAVNALTAVADCDDYINTFYSKITFGVTAGQTYHVAIDGYRPAVGSFQVFYQLTPAADNDFSYSPEDLDNLDHSPLLGITGSNVGATGTIGEPVHFSNSVLPLNSVWYRWTPPATGTYTFTTEGSDFDTVIAVYFSLTGNILGSRGANDDFGPPGVFTSQVTFFAFSGETFLIAVDGYGNDVGNLVLNWHQSREEGGMRFDMDGDARSDVAIFRPSNGQWWVKSPFLGTYAVTFGTPTDKPAPADFTGDGKVDIAVWRPSDGYWYVLRSEDFSYYALPFGTNGDIPAPGKFDNDGKADHAVFRPSTGTWYIRKSRNGIAVQQGFGLAGDIPVANDFDGDGVTDIAIYRPSNGQWWINRSTGGVVALTFGAAGDLPVPGAYTGLGFANVAFWRPSTGEWFVLRYLNSGSYYSIPFGLPTDIPAPGDFDGDNKYDTAVFRPSEGLWYIQRSAGPLVVHQFGLSGDRPVQSSYIP